MESGREKARPEGVSSAAWSCVWVWGGRDKANQRHAPRTVRPPQRVVPPCTSSTHDTCAQLPAPWLCLTSLQACPHAAPEADAVVAEGYVFFRASSYRSFLYGIWATSATQLLPWGISGLLACSTISVFPRDGSHTGDCWRRGLNTLDSRSTSSGCFHKSHTDSAAST